ncbi:MAG TPA: hypothetical protein VIY69_17665 [Candidatus Acidoferrales bacterium]
MKISVTLVRSLIFVKEPRPQIAFGDITKGLPEYGPKSAWCKFLVYRNGERLTLSGRQNPAQLGVASANSEYRESKVAEGAQNFARGHLAQAAHQAAGTS